MFFVCIIIRPQAAIFAQRMWAEGRSGRISAVLCPPAWLIYFWPKLHIFPCCCCRLLLLVADVASCCRV